MSARPLLRADSVGKRYADRRVLTAATLLLHPGRITALLGRNGCGKSTLLRIITGLTRADHGNIEFREQRVPRPRLHRLALAGLFYMPERDLLCRTHTLYDHFQQLYARFGARRENALADARDRLLPATRLNRLPDELSNGERRRAELALALARAPDCLLADEPFMGLAPKDAEVMSEAMRTLAQTGAAVLATGHEVELLLAVADDVVWLTAGTTHYFGSVRAALAHDQLRREYLGPRAPHPA